MQELMDFHHVDYVVGNHIHVFIIVVYKEQQLLFRFHEVIPAGLQFNKQTEFRSHDIWIIQRDKLVMGCVSLKRCSDISRTNSED